jgi:hypothetical protein
VGNIQGHGKRDGLLRFRGRGETRVPKYRVYYQTGASASVEVEARDQETAWEAAEKVFSSPQPCWHCSGEFDLGDWEPVEDEWGTELVAE